MSATSSTTTVLPINRRLNNGFDLPSAFKNNFIKRSIIGGRVDHQYFASWINELRMQYADREFRFSGGFDAAALEVSNVFAVGVNRGNPDIYRENRFEMVDNVTKTGTRIHSASALISIASELTSRSRSSIPLRQISPTSGVPWDGRSGGLPAWCFLSRSIRDFLPAI